MRPPRRALLVPASLLLVLTAGCAGATRGSAGHGIPSAAVAPLRQLRTVSLLVVAPSTLTQRLTRELAGLRGVTGTEPMDAARISVGGVSMAVAGVDPSSFRSYARPVVAKADGIWQGMAGGGIVVSQPADGAGPGDWLVVSGQHRLRIAAFASAGIGGVDAMVSDQVARTLGMPMRNALIVSTDSADVPAVMTGVQALLPPGAAVAPQGRFVATGVGGGPGAGAAAPSQAQVRAMLNAALSRVGMPYVWAAAGPNAFDCSGLVRWAFARAGLNVPRVAADQALAGSAVPAGKLAPGDLLFYRTEPDEPGYISHVAIYLGNGLMIQAPQSGENVQVVPANVSSNFAGALRVDPRIASSLTDVVP